MHPSEIKTSFALGSIFAFRMLGLFMILPVFSLYAEHLPHATPTLIGLTLGIYGLTQALFQLPFGIWSDFISRKKVIAIGLMLFIVGSIVAALSHTLYGIILGRALQGAGAIGSTTIALVGDLTSIENRTKAMAIVGISIAFAFMLAMIIGPVLGHTIGVPGIFWLTAVFGALGLGLLFFTVPNPEHTHREFNLALLPSQFQKIFSDLNIFRWNLSILLAHMLLMAFFVVLPTLLVNHYHFTLAHQWKIYLPILVAVMLVIGKLMRHQNFAAQEYRYGVLCVALIFFTQGIFAIGWVSNALLLYLTLFLFFFAFTFLEALLPSLVSKSVSSEYRGTATGIFSSCQFLGIFLGGIWGGTLSQLSQFFGVFLGNTILALLWLFVMLPLLFKPAAGKI